MTQSNDTLDRSVRSDLDKHSPRLLLACLCVSCVVGCGGSEGPASAESSGGNALGGATAFGGATDSTGNVVMAPRGGATASSAGIATGGVATSSSSVSGGTGGIAASGSAPTSAHAKGGAPSGGSTVGGSSAAGGAAASFGGASGSTISTAAKSMGCGKAPTLTSGSRTIQSGGKTRSFMLRIPANYDKSRPYRLIFAFHWNGGTMIDVDGGGTSGYTWSYYGLREQADSSPETNTIFVAPQGNGNGWANPGGEDLTFVDDMLKQVEEDLCVDTTRIFSMGFSYGGGMTYAIACDRAKVFRAAAVYAGAQLSGCDDGTKPIAFMGLHGLRDPTCGIAGGRSLRDKFVKNNGCTAQTPEEPAAKSLSHVCTTYSGCSSGYPVRWCAFDGAGHSPAPVDGATSDSGGGDKTWTKGEVWKFFLQF